MPGTNLSSSGERNPIERLAAEYVERQRRGEHPSLSEYAEKYPELAEEIRLLFPSLALLERLKPVLEDEADSGAAGPSPAPSFLSNPAGRLGDYRIIRELGRGGMGVVYEAVQESMGRHVALKILATGRRLSPAEIERFRLEARAAGRLHHGGIVPVYGVGEHEGVPYYAMQFIRGNGLDAILNELRRLRTPADGSPTTAQGTGAIAGPDATPLAGSLLTASFPGAVDGAREPAPAITQNSGAAATVPGSAMTPAPAPVPRPSTSRQGSGATDSSMHSLAMHAQLYSSVARIGLQVADALAYAHREGVLHRDIKPSNLLLDADGHVWITDFGLARIEGSDHLTRTGDMVGTVRYMAPERFDGWSDRRSDVYGLGATLYELATLHPLFTSRGQAELIQSVLHAEPERPRKLDPKIPLDLETICLKCLEKEPARRYASASDLAGDLRRYLAGEPIVARPLTRSERAVKWARRKPAIAALLALVTAVTAIGLGGVLWEWRAAVHARNDAELASDRANAQTKLAELRLKDVLNAQASEREQTALAERRLYDARMNLVQRCWEDYNGELLHAGLAEQLPASQRGVDRRDFEWFYWNRKISSGHITLTGHTKPVRSVAFSPDRSQLASASQDGTVKVWNAATGQETLTFKGHARDVKSVAFSPDGKRIASASADNTVKVWDPATGREYLTLTGHTDPLECVAYSADGTRIASAGLDKTVRVWDAVTGREIRVFTGHTHWVWSVAFSPDSTRIASASFDGTVKLWYAAAGEEAVTLKGNTHFIKSAVFSPDGKRIAGGGVGMVKLWDAATGEESITLKGHTSQVLSVAYSPDGKRIASASLDQTVKVWDASSGLEIHTLKGHTNGVWSVSFSPDGTRIASAGDDHTVKVWDAVSGQKTMSLRGHAIWIPINSVSFSPDRTRLAFPCDNQAVKVWDVATGRELVTLYGHTSEVNSATFSTDGAWIASASSDNTVKLWDAATGSEARTLKGHTSEVWSVAFSPDGKRIASASSDGTVKVWDAATGRELLTLTRHTSNIYSVAFSPDSKQIAATDDDTVKVWDAATGQESLTLKGHISTVFGVAFSPDGSRLASAGQDGMVRLWDTLTGRQALTLKGHTQVVWSVAFSPDGKRLASASLDGTARVWDALTGQETLALKQSPVRIVAFSSDGSQLASGCIDGTVHVWDARPPGPDPEKPGKNAR